MRHLVIDDVIINLNYIRYVFPHIAELRIEIGITHNQSFFVDCDDKKELLRIYQEITKALGEVVPIKGGHIE